MNTKTNKFGSGLLVFLMATMAGFSAHGDDTEIFFGGNGNPGIQPNVLFILDNSASMDNKDCPNGGTSCNNPTRMQRLKSAMNSLLDSLNNVNVGLMQFSFPGGAILYPVTDIDAPLLKPQSLSLSITNGEDDAEEANGNVTLTNEIIALTKRDSSGTTRVSPAISASADDAEEVASTGAVTTNSTSLTLTEGRLAGLIFRNQAIPQNARILSANIVFTVEQATGDDMLEEELHLEIQGQLSTSYSSLNAFSAANNIGSRNKTNTKIQWNIIDPPPAVGETIISADIAPVIQEIISDTNWSSGGDIALFLQNASSDPGTGKRVFSSFDAGNTRRPVLNITYETRQSDAFQTVGLRFNDVAVPRGARITSATLEFQAAAADAGTPATYTIFGEKVANSAPFTDDSNNLTSRPDTTASVSWTPSWISDSSTAWRPGEIHSTLDDGANLAPIIEEIVNQADWCGGNSLSLFITGGGDARFISAFEHAGSNSPKLKITYDPNDIPAGEGCMATTFSYRVSSNTDDGRGRSSTSTSNDVLNDTSLPLGTYDGNAIYTGFRFTNLQIPRNATVLSAYLEFTASANNSGSSNLTIKVQDSNNAGALCTGGTGCTRLRSRTYWETTTVAWNNVPAFTSGMVYRSPDIASLVQRIVNKGTWNPGNAMLFAINGSGTRYVTPHDNNPASAPRLVIRIAQASNAVGGTTRDALKSIVSDIEPVTNTPIVDSLYEAALYFRGEALQWGDRRYHSPYNYVNHNTRNSQWNGFNDSIAPRLRVAHPDSYTGGTVSYPSGCSADNPNSKNCKEEAITGSPRYISPIIDQCQTNHIVLLTDGAPTGSGSANLVKSLIGQNTCVDSEHAACGPELAKFLFDNDHSPLPGKQNIYTHTIAFNLNNATDTNFLDRIAKSGNGGSGGVKSANTATELEQVFRNITGEIIGSVNTTFVSPGVTVNSFNRLTHRNELYFALFRPETRPSWPGNLKRYRITTSGDILDRNGVSVIDPETGMFIDNAQSYWSPASDGNDVTKGGASSQLPTSATRKIYTHLQGQSTTLSHASNAVTTTNTNITKAVLGLDNAASDTYRNNLINWARGLDPETGNERKRLADPLHSIPHLVTYGGTDENPDIVIFHGDNEGFLHATRASDGVELFAFIPEQLLPNLKLLYENSGATKHPYGMDGPISSWVLDVNGDSQINAANGDHVYIYAGMRRGGRNLYALDVTNRDAPVLLWTITGGSGDYAELGQTWSRPVKTKVNLGGTIKDVLVMGGGYDPGQDDATVITPDNMGRAIFIIDAATGAKLWSVGPTDAHNLVKADMQYSIPANVRIIDTNGDGLMDQMYVGDVGGQLWRFDVHQGNAANSLVTGGVIADISGTTPASARRFYHEPEVSLIVENNRRKLAIVIGSGFHAHPLDQTIVDRIYMIKQSAVTSAPADGNDADTDPDYVKLTEANLYDATENLIQEGNTEEQAVALASLAAADGWYITLEDDGEKVLSRPLVVSSQLLISTYSPTLDQSGCNPTVGTSRLYHLRLVDAGAVNETRSETLQTIGIPPSPVRLRIIEDPEPPEEDEDDPENEQEPEGSTTADVICVGTFCKPLGDSVSVIKTYWHNE